MSAIPAPAPAPEAARAAARTYLQLIDGQLVPGASSIPVVDPATELTITEAPVASDGQIEEAITAAHRAFATWSTSPLGDRHAVIAALADEIEKRADEIAELITLEQGKTLIASRADVDLAITWARYYAEYAPRETVVRDDEDGRVVIYRRPIGVVAAIVPWNFPFFQAVYKVAPALVVGNTVVLKPAPTTPLNSHLLGEILADLVPAGVVNVIGDDGGVGPKLTGHPLVDKVSFTGSTAAGKAVMASSAATLKRLTLELGGNDAAIVLDDADLDAAVDGIFAIAFHNSGQVCINIKRIFLHDSLFDEFAARFAAKAAATRVGSGLDPSSDLGPLQNKKQYDAIKRLLAVAHRDGHILAGGQAVDGPGYFIEPTVVAEIDDSSELVEKETFGPIRSLLRYTDVVDAVARANASPYGLGASVWGSDLDRASAVAAQLTAGTVWINHHFALTPDVPFGGVKESGVGSEFGDEGIAGMTNVQVINVKR